MRWNEKSGQKPLRVDAVELLRNDFGWFDARSTVGGSGQSHGGSDVATSELRGDSGQWADFGDFLFLFSRCLAFLQSIRRALF